jgi:hypothetical protein
MRQGDQVGRWQLRRYLYPNPVQGITEGSWECQCQCGTVRPVPENALIREQSRSCGCLKREGMRSRRGQPRHTKFGRVLA